MKNLALALSLLLAPAAFAVDQGAFFGSAYKIPGSNSCGTRVLFEKEYTFALNGNLFGTNNASYYLKTDGTFTTTWASANTWDLSDVDVLVFSLEWAGSGGNIGWGFDVTSRDGLRSFDSHGVAPGGAGTGGAVTVVGKNVVTISAVEGYESWSRNVTYPYVKLWLLNTNTFVMDTTDRLVISVVGVLRC